MLSSIVIYQFIYILLYYLLIQLSEKMSILRHVNVIIKTNYTMINW